MSAVVVEWKGCCPNRQAQNDLICQVKPLGRRNAVRWKRMIRARVRRHKASWKEAVAGRYITQAMADRVLEDDRLTELQHIRLFNHELTGSILVSSSVVLEPAASWSRKAKLLGLRLEMPRGPDKPFLIRSDSIRVFGIDFRLFDPAELEKDDYRVSFVFVESEEMPSLNGHIVEVLGRESLLSNSCEAIRSADWLLESPGVYIHYVMGTFMARLLRLVKYFFMPGLYYWYYDPLDGYETVSQELDERVKQMGIEGAKKEAFDDLERWFELEADAGIGLRAASGDLSF